MCGYTDRMNYRNINPEFGKLLSSRVYQWPMECDFQEMTQEELRNLRLERFEAWAENEE